MVFFHFMEISILCDWVLLHFKIQCTSKMFLYFDIFFLQPWRNQSCFEHQMLQCFKMFQNECCFYYDGFFSKYFFCLSAQLKLISASLDSTTWPFFVQLGPCMSFQSFTQMHFYSFLWKTSTPCFECFYFTSKSFQVDKRVEVFFAQDRT